MTHRDFCSSLYITTDNAKARSKLHMTLMACAARAAEIKSTAIIAAGKAYGLFHCFDWFNSLTGADLSNVLGCCI